jgi:hypothetical protein
MLAAEVYLHLARREELLAVKVAANVLHGNITPRR